MANPVPLLVFHTTENTTAYSLIQLRTWKLSLNCFVCFHAFVLLLFNPPIYSIIKIDSKPAHISKLCWLISHTSKIILKILQARLQQCVNRELSDVQAGFRKSTCTREQIANICWIIEKAREFQQSIYFFTDYTKAFDCVDHNKLWTILKKMGIPDHFTYVLRNLCRSQE